MNQHSEHNDIDVSHPISHDPEKMSTEDAQRNIVVYLAIFNPSPRNNLGTLIRCAAAFAVEEIVVVGVSKWSTHGAHGSQKAGLRFHEFETSSRWWTSLHCLRRAITLPRNLNTEL